eukprot:3819777-Rhodomonas_salina.1
MELDRAREDYFMQPPQEDRIPASESEDAAKQKRLYYKNKERKEMGLAFRDTWPLRKVLFPKDPSGDFWAQSMLEDAMDLEQTARFNADVA